MGELFLLIPPDAPSFCRPLAGTRRRGRTLQEDAELEADLLADEKERAEHVMLLDLGRNDVGRVSVAGSVKARPQSLRNHETVLNRGRETVREPSWSARRAAVETRSRS